jgi:hypothetical protein
MVSLASMATPRTTAVCLLKGNTCRTCVLLLIFGFCHSLNNPTGVAVTSDGAVIIADTDNNRVLLFAPKYPRVHGRLQFYPEYLCQGQAEQETDVVQGRCFSFRSSSLMVESGDPSYIQLFRCIQPNPLDSVSSGCRQVNLDSVTRVYLRWTSFEATTGHLTITDTSVTTMTNPVLHTVPLHTVATLTNSTLQTNTSTQAVMAALRTTSPQFDLTTTTTPTTPGITTIETIPPTTTASSSCPCCVCPTCNSSTLSSCPSTPREVSHVGSFVGLFCLGVLFGCAAMVGLMFVLWKLKKWSFGNGLSERGEQLSTALQMREQIQDEEIFGDEFL